MSKETEKKKSLTDLKKFLDLPQNSDMLRIMLNQLTAKTHLIHQTHTFNTIACDLNKITVEQLLKAVQEIKQSIPSSVDPNLLADKFLASARVASEKKQATFGLPNGCCSLNDCPTGQFFMALYKALQFLSETPPISQVNVTNS